MALLELVYDRLKESTAIANKLAKHNNIPAIHYQSSPGDKDRGWSNKQYPRITYMIDMQANTERQSSGQMVLDIFCKEDGIGPEEIETEVRAALRDVFMAPVDGPVYCFAWNRSDTFEERYTESLGNIVGITVLFDIIAFPAQETTNPDPVTAIYAYIKSWNTAATIIGKDTLPEYFSAEESRPAFYLRLVGLERYQEQNWGVWMNGVLKIHVFSPTASERLSLIKSLTEALAICGEVKMTDNSPMFLTGIGADSTADYLTNGQIRLDVRYGILRPVNDSPLLKNITLGGSI